MPVITLTAFMRDDDAHGWEEAHQVDGGAGSPSLTPFLTAFDNLMKTFRVPLLAADGYYIGCRASYKTATNQTAGSNLLADIPIKGPDKIGGESVEMNLASDAVKIRMQNAASTANSDVYLRGVPDQIIQAGQLLFSGKVGGPWKRSLQAYTDALKGAAYGWFGENPALSPKGNVTAVVQNADGTVTFTVATTNGAPMPAAGTKIAVGFAKINNSKSILNRTFVCVVVNNTTLTTMKQISFGSFDTPGTFRIRVVGFIPYDHYSYARAGTRKTGRPFGAGRGRLSAQTLH